MRSVLDQRGQLEELVVARASVDGVVLVGEIRTGKIGTRYVKDLLRECHAGVFSVLKRRKPGLAVSERAVVVAIIRGSEVFTFVRARVGGRVDEKRNR